MTSSSLRVLVVEDREADCQLMLHELRRAGIDPQWQRVETEAAYLAALHTPPDVILSDNRLPEFDSGRAFQLLKSRGLDVPFIIVSGTIGEELAVQALKDGVCDYLLKDRLDRLGSAVKHAVLQKRLRSERQELEAQLRQSQRMEAIGRLAGGIAHDFNNLLTPILGYSEMILARLKPSDPLWEEVELIRSSGERAATLTRQLLAYSRKQVLKPRVVNLNWIAADVQKLLRRLIGENISVDFKLDPQLGTVEVDPSQMDQVLLNLAVNARDAMPTGGRLLIETSNIQLDEAYASSHGGVPPGSYVMIAVSDTGTGMDTNTLSHLFEPFFTTKEQGKGTGLGLATVQGIVRQSGGHLWVYSEPGHGSTFKIYLPRTRKEADTDFRSKARPDATPGGTETILVIEDEPVLRTLAVRVLEGKGYRVLSAAHGDAAMATVRAHPEGIDLCLTDVVMPGLSGVETAAQLQALRPHLKVLFMSGYTANTVAHYGLMEKGLDLLEKPFTPDQLACRVREILDGSGPGSA